MVSYSLPPRAHCQPATKWGRSFHVVRYHWPRLFPLHEGRDLALTTNFRDVFAEVAMRHLGVNDLTTIFPGYEISTKRFREFMT